MNQLVDPHTLISAIPLPAPKPPAMTRYEKLMRWAQLVRNAPTRMYLMHGLEYYTPDQLKVPAFHYRGPDAACSAFGLAMADPVLAEAGLKSSVEATFPGTGAISDIMGFMELTQQQLHEFSCDCGGSISNTDMADRIERLA
jgi:hypothetical protein